MPAVESALVAAYWSLAGALALFGLYFLVIVALRASVSQTESTPALTRHPFVTLQVPVRNERHVVRRVLDAVSALHWPQDRIEVQVVDDSDDDTTTIVEAAIKSHRSRGLSIHHVRRVKREGHKAGALNDALELAQGDAIAVFDADFVPPAHFLERVVPWLSEGLVACVQTGWSHLNEESTWTSRAVAIGLDAHFEVEQLVRAHHGWMMSFNATSCVWDRRALQRHGGWPTQTLTEDLDLTLRLLCEGERFRFVQTTRSLCELPAEPLGFALQQARWAQGGAQNLRRHARTIIASRQLGLAAKVDAFVHLLHYGFQPALLGLFLLALAFAWLGVTPHAPTAAALATVAGVGPLALLIAGQRRRHPGRWIARLRRIPTLVLLGLGIGPRVSLGFLAGLMGARGVFLRTPKYGPGVEAGGWRRSPYRPRPDAVTAVELVLVALGLWFGTRAALAGRWALALSILAYAGAIAWVALASLRAAGQRSPRGTPAPAPTDPSKQKV
jgi:hypothetical protein